jgi:hypothetical protein
MGHACAQVRAYLDAWLPILSSVNSRILFIDGFAGPGEYAGSEEGSPQPAALNRPHGQVTRGSRPLRLTNPKAGRPRMRQSRWPVPGRPSTRPRYRYCARAHRAAIEQSTRCGSAAFWEGARARPSHGFHLAGGLLRPSGRVPRQPFQNIGTPAIFSREIVAKNNASVLFTLARTVSSIPRCLSYPRDTVSLEIGDPPIRRTTSVRNYEPASGA